MTTEPAASSPAIAQDVPCITCGYNLRGLNPGGACPECATLIQFSIDESQVRASSASAVWARCMIVGLIGWVLITGFGVLLRWYVNVGEHGRYPGPQLWADNLRTFSQSEPAMAQPTAHSGPMWASACLLMIYLVTAPRISALTESVFSLRRITRWFSIVLGAFMIAQSRLFAGWNYPQDAALFVTLIGTVLLYIHIANIAKGLGLVAEQKAMCITAAIAGVTMGLTFVWRYAQSSMGGPGFPTTLWIYTETGKRVDSICSTAGLVGAVIAAGTMIRIALAILPMAALREKWKS